MVEAGGVGILSLIDKAQLIDFNKREKRQNQRICQSAVPGGYMGFRKSDLGAKLTSIVTLLKCQVRPQPLS